MPAAPLKRSATGIATRALTSSFGSGEGSAFTTSGRRALKAAASATYSSVWWSAPSTVGFRLIWRGRRNQGAEERSLRLKEPVCGEVNLLVVEQCLDGDIMRKRGTDDAAGSWIEFLDDCGLFECAGKCGQDFDT